MNVPLLPALLAPIGTESNVSTTIPAYAQLAHTGMAMSAWPSPTNAHQGQLGMAIAASLIPLNALLGIIGTGTNVRLSNVDALKVWNTSTVNANSLEVSVPKEPTTMELHVSRSHPALEAEFGTVNYLNASALKMVSGMAKHAIFAEMVKFMVALSVATALMEHSSMESNVSLFLKATVPTSIMLIGMMVSVAASPGTSPQA